MSQGFARIHILPDQLINQIAAGEVIERPASVVKELLDNSIDAGATCIHIDIERGGIGLIRVRDDGHGIHYDDLVLAMTRHATSKIQQLADLRTLMTMGFRGEALPSIASISRFTLTSRYQGEELAWQIKGEGRADCSAPRPTSQPPGSTVEVWDLFFNTPARRKYLRSERTEFYQIHQRVRQVAISHPELAIRLSHNGRQVLYVPTVKPGDEVERIRAICGEKFIEHARQLDASIERLRLTGWVGDPQAARTVNDTQFFSLNGRNIRDKRINHAIQQAFQPCLPEGRFAAYALSLEIDPSQVDVNVHPAKVEVRFIEGRKVHDFIYSALNGVLSETELISNNVMAVTNNNRVEPGKPQPFRHVRPAPPALPRIRETNSSYKTGGLSVIDTVQRTHEHRPGPLCSAVSVGKILLLKSASQLLIVDMIRAMEWLFRQRLRAELKLGTIEVKPLLFPIRLTVSQPEEQVILSNRDLLKQAGIRLHDSGQQAIQLLELPACLQNFHPGKLVQELIEVLKHAQPAGRLDLILTSLAHHQACHTSKDMCQSYLLQSDNLEKLSEQPGLLRELSEADLQAILTTRADLT